MHSPDHIRNLAIIAHIDHGKTTLIDSVFRAARVFRDNARIEERVMDSNDLERERGITIRSKHCTVEWGDYLINIIDTPGHADFSGEVERVLSMVNSVLLLVDANEGPMPQTRYVLMRALRLGLRPIVIVNKADRPNADPSGALDATFDLFVELGASNEQLDFPVLYGSGLEGWIVNDIEEYRREERDREEHLAGGGELSPAMRAELAAAGMTDLFETIIASVPAPRVDLEAPFLMQVSTLAWSDYIGRIGCGRVLQGRLRIGDELRRIQTKALDTDEDTVGDALTEDGGGGGFAVAAAVPARVTHLWVTRGLENSAVDEVTAGDIAWLAGPDEIAIGDTLAAPELDPQAVALPPLEIEEPTVSMFFLVNNGPFAGEDGRAVTLRQIKDRLERELRVNVALRVEDLGRPDGVKVSGRGELHLAILIEEMRREGMELCVSKPEVITHRDARGRLLEPLEQLVIDVPEQYQGGVIQELSQRKGELTAHARHPHRPGAARVHDHDSRTDRLPQRLPDRDPRPRRDELAVRRLRPLGRRPARPRARFARQPDGRRGGRLRAREPAAARHAVRTPDGARLRGHDRGRELARRRYALQPHQTQAARQLPPVDQGHRRRTQGAARTDARKRARVDRRRRAGRGHAAGRPGAQAHPQLRGAQESGQAGTRAIAAVQTPRRGDMDVFEAIASRYSVRGYKADPVDDETLDRVLQAARQAPTAANRQPFRIIVVHTAGREDDLARLYGRPWLLQAPFVLVMVAVPAEAWRRMDGKRYDEVDATIAMDHLVLAATALGLGTCWIAAFDPGAAREVLGLPDDVEPIALTPLGYPDKRRAKTDRRPLDELVRYERW